MSHEPVQVATAGHTSLWETRYPGSGHLGLFYKDSQGRCWALTRDTTAELAPEEFLPLVKTQGRSFASWHKDVEHLYEPTNEAVVIDEVEHRIWRKKHPVEENGGSP